MCFNLKQKAVMPDSIESFAYIKENHLYIISIVKYYTNVIVYSNKLVVSSIPGCKGWLIGFNYFI